ncbi:MAG TPA: RNA polymerase sigma factor [Hyphomicrobiales bacterium]|nr:RNA polymerase sigma factor [Hyphomicrobiales bacterium]
MSAIELARPRPLEDLGEAELAERACRQEPAAFREVMRRHNRRLFRVARSVLGDDAEAEDAVQETYLKAYAALPGYRGEASLGTWLTRIALNEAIGRRRRRRDTTDLDILERPAEAKIVPFNPNAPDDPERSAARRQLRTVIEQAVDTLPEAFRTVFVMRDIEEMSVAETARFLHIRPETVKTRLHRARRLLRKALDAELSATLQDAFPFAGWRCDRVIARVEAILFP